jgi:hypothetical protein
LGLNPVKVSNFYLLSLAKVQQKFCKSAEKIPQNVEKVFDKPKIKKILLKLLNKLKEIYDVSK